MQQLKGPWLQMTGDFLDFELRPSFTISYRAEFPFTTNRWGMRDKEYSRVAPPRTFRIALLGASVEMGAGVPVESRCLEGTIHAFMWFGGAIPMGLDALSFVASRLKQTLTP